MPEINRQHKRIDKIVTLQYSFIDDFPKKWDMSVIKNISAGGIMFVASNDLKLKDKVIQLKIKIPQLAPHSLDLDAIVVSTTTSFNGKSSEVRAKFINISEENKARLAIVERIIDKQAK